jgi:hypothetical protein
MRDAQLFSNKFWMENRKTNNHELLSYPQLNLIGNNPISQQRANDNLTQLNAAKY